MELLPEGQTNTSVEVTYSDQQKINKFSTLISQKDSLIIKRDNFKIEKEYLDDLSIELELLDEEDKIMYKVGDVFIELIVSDALIKVNDELNKLNDEIDEIDLKIEKIDDVLSDLKIQLYDKFGKNINLER